MDLTLSLIQERTGPSPSIRKIDRTEFDRLRLTIELFGLEHIGESHTEIMKEGHGKSPSRVFLSTLWLS